MERPGYDGPGSDLTCCSRSFQVADSALAAACELIVNMRTAFLDHPRIKLLFGGANLYYWPNYDIWSGSSAVFHLQTVLLLMQPSNHRCLPTLSG
jgi:hypothetical protein